jgi:exopolysaccharide biosynthesis polyprenyl glycosylphosphotransferase
VELRVDQHVSALAGVDAGMQAGSRERRRSRQRLALIAALMLVDAIAICAGFTLAYLVRFNAHLGVFYEHQESPLGLYVALVPWLLPLILVVFTCYQLYSVKRIIDGPREYSRIVSATTMSVMLIVLLSFVIDSGLVIARGWIAIAWVTLIACVGIGRFVFRRAIYAARRAGYLRARVIVIGSGQDAQFLAGHIRDARNSGLEVVTVIDGRALEGPEAEPEGTPALQRLIAATQAEALIVSAASVPQRVLSQIVREVSQLPTQLHVIPGMYEILTTGVQTAEVSGLPLVTMNKVRITGLDLLLKRVLDYSVAFAVLLALSPIMLLAAALVKLTSPGPVLHRRRVVGQQGRTFDALKFRTMHVDGDAILRRHPELAEQLARYGKLLDDPRITPVGAFLRRWSLDELPQLFNVLLGQMSLVGPRMITQAELDHFGHWRENLCTVKPGLTGLWQVSGRSDLGYDDRVRLDMHYIRSYSIWADIEILIRTLPAVLHGTGAY